MPLLMSQVFNSTGDVSNWMTASNTFVTGSPFLTVIVLFTFLILMALLFKMPTMLVFVILTPLLLVFASIGEFAASLNLIIGIVVLVIALGLYALYPSK